jgi:hypothetical protein
MRKHILVLGTIAAVALLVAVVSGLKDHRQAFSATQAATMSIDELHRHVNPASLPVTQVDEPY